MINIFLVLTKRQKYYIDLRILHLIDERHVPGKINLIMDLEINQSSDEPDWFKQGLN